jgi:hypothetical protein
MMRLGAVHYVIALVQGPGVELDTVYPCLHGIQHAPFCFMPCSTPVKSQVNNGHVILILEIKCFQWTATAGGMGSPEAPLSF